MHRLENIRRLRARRSRATSTRRAIALQIRHGRAHARAAWWCCAIAVALGGVWAGVASAGTAAPAPRPPALAGAASRQYACDATSTPNSAQEDYFPLAHGVSAVNLWNVTSSAGSIRRCYGTAGLTTAISLSRVVQNGAGPAGYPEVAYGFGLTDRPFCPTANACQTKPFPLATTTLRNSYLLSTTYAIGATPVPYDFIYDFWLERSPTAGGPVTCTSTDAPPSCPQPGDVELLIVLDHRAIPFCKSAPSQVSEPLTLDDRASAATWTVCSIAGGTEATSVAFFLDRPAERRSASVSLQPKAFVDAALSFLGHGYATAAYDLMGVELGGEFDSCSTSNCQPAWSWRLGQLALRTPEGTIRLLAK
jgi:hypothetical protein